MYGGESLLRTQIITNYQGIRELEIALFNLGKSCEELFSQLRSATEVHSNRKYAHFIHCSNELEDNSQFLLDHRYIQSSLSRGGYRALSGTNGNLRGSICGSSSGT